MSSFKKIVWVLIVLGFLSCKQKWTDKDKVEFVSGCMSKAIKDMGEVKAKAYCSCMLGKIVIKYPNANDVNYIKNDSVIVRMAKDCLKQP